MINFGTEIVITCLTSVILKIRPRTKIWPTWCLF